MDKMNVCETQSSGYYLGIDVGGTTVKLGLFRVDDIPAQPGGRSDRVPGESTVPGRPVLLDRTVIPTRIEDGGIHILPDIAQAAQRLAGACSVPVADIRGAGIGVPGPVLPTTDQGTPVDGCVNLGWTGIWYIDRQLQELTGIRQICVLNDANAAALGELYYGGGARTGAPMTEDAPASDPDAPAGTSTGIKAVAESAVMVTIGTGIGGGIISGGRIISGAFGAGGEIGHMPASPGHPLLREICGRDASLRQSADLEYYASATGITRMAQSALRNMEEPSSLRDIDDLTARDVIDAAKDGDAAALQVLDFFFDTLGRGLATIASVVDPQLFIIGGGVSAAGAYLLDGLQKSYREHVFHPSRDADFRLAVLGNDAGLLGPLVPLLYPPAL